MVDRTMGKTLISVLCLMPFATFAEEALDVVTRQYTDPVYTSSVYSQGGSSEDLMRGQFLPVNHTVISAGMDGRLKRFEKRTGMSVSRDEVIAVFSCEDQEAEKEVAQARVKAAAKNLEVNKKLDEYQNVSELELTISEVELSIAEAELQRTRVALNHCEVKAPFSGTVTQKFVQAFQYVNKGEPLLEIVDTRNVEIEMVLPSREVAQYSKGRGFSIQVDETGALLDAEIDRVVNVIDPVSQTIRVIGHLKETPPHLMPGMSGVILLETN